MSDDQIKLILIDDDQIFDIGLVSVLANYNIEVVAIVNAASAGEKLEQEDINLIMLELNLQLCKWLRKHYPNLPILLLTNKINTEELLAAKKMGVKGHCFKTTEIAEIVKAINLVAAQESYWAVIPESKEIVIKNTWIVRQCQIGLQQIDNNLESVKNYLENSQMDFLDRLYWGGRKRELKAARWLVSQLLPIKVNLYPLNSDFEEENLDILNNTAKLIKADSENLDISLKDEPTAIVLDNIAKKISPDLENLTGVILEIDILKPRKRKELIEIVYKQIIELLIKLKESEIAREELIEKNENVIKEIWLYSIINFLKKNDDFNEKINQITQEKIILTRWESRDILAYLVFQNPIIVDRVEYRVEAPEAIKRASILLENLIIKIANAVMEVILNLDEDILADKLYDNKYKSSREIARFRNRISGQYRIEKYWEEPKNMFEDKYSVYYFDEIGIKKEYIKESRKEEVKQLRGIKAGVTILIEARDALAPGVRATVDLLGRAIVYVLVNVVGKAIALIATGVFQESSSVLENDSERKRKVGRKIFKSAKIKK